jgi:hypothetical protein
MEPTRALPKGHEPRSQPRRKQLPNEEWEHHKWTILELYKTTELGDLRSEMLEKFGFDAS